MTILTIDELYSLCSRAMADGKGHYPIVFSDGRSKQHLGVGAVTDELLYICISPNACKVDDIYSNLRELRDGEITMAELLENDEGAESYTHFIVWAMTEGYISAAGITEKGLDWLRKADR